MTRRRRLGLSELLFALVLSGAILMTGLGGLVMGARSRARAQVTERLENEARHAAMVWAAHKKAGAVQKAAGWTRVLSADETRRVACDTKAQVTLRFDAGDGVLWRTYRCGDVDGTPHRVANRITAMSDVPGATEVSAVSTSLPPVEVHIRVP